MATIKFYEPTNMLAFDWKFGFPTDVAKLQKAYIYNASSFDDGGAVVYRGTFAYNSIINEDGSSDILGLRSGTLTGYEWYESQILRARMTGLSYDAISAFIYMELSQEDSTYSVALMEELLTGNDKINGSTFDDVLAGFAGDDTINGGRRHDSLYGNDGEDILGGDAGNDSLVGGAGVDTLTGGAGKDTFRYDSVKDLGDIITDFNSGGGDRFEFVAEEFAGGLAAGSSLDASQFQSSASADAATAEVRFIYDNDNFTLYFDVDGSGAEASVLVATLQIGAVVTASDILLV